MDSSRIRVVYEAINHDPTAYRDLVRLLASWADECRAKLRSAGHAEQIPQDNKRADIVDPPPGLITITITTAMVTGTTANPQRRSGRPAKPIDAERVKELQAKGLSIRQIARVTGISKSGIGVVLRGLANPRADVSKYSQDNS